MQLPFSYLQKESLRGGTAYCDEKLQIAFCAQAKSLSQGAYKSQVETWRYPIWSYRGLSVVASSYWINSVLCSHDDQL